jgi:signal transduction histidine kinase
MFDSSIYRNKERIKIAIVAGAGLLALVSLLYTNSLVKLLKERELQQIDLFAKAMAYASNPNEASEVSFIFDEIIQRNHTIPTVVCWEDNGKITPSDSRNLDIPLGLTDSQKDEFLMQQVALMKQEYEPIVQDLGQGLKQHIYFAHSEVITRLSYYTYIQVGGAAVFILFVYLIFSTSRRAEQNRVWVGLAKETAHQLGTPISSLIAWAEYIKAEPDYDPAIAEGMMQDIRRLEMITARFSSIGSEPQLKKEPVFEVVRQTLDYLQSRISPKVAMKVETTLPENFEVRINKALFEWVIENLTKNAVDAMGGSGKFSVLISQRRSGQIYIDFTDNGKGIPKGLVHEVFMPGFTTKKRGWGLGLTLVKRIVENYHKGKIFVKWTEKDQGTTFRVVLPAANTSVAASEKKTAAIS